MNHRKTRVITRLILLVTAICTIASLAIPPAANAALLPLPKKPLDPVTVALNDALKSVQDLLSQAGPAQAALQGSADAFQAKIQQIIADGQEDPTTIQPAIEALTANPTGIINSTPLTSLALSLAAKAAQPICPVVGALAAETAGVAVPTMPDYTVFGPLADVVKQYDQTGMNTIRDYYVQVFAKLLAPITGAPAQAQSVLALANVLLNLIAINWHTTNYPADGGAPIVHDTPGFLFLPTLVDTDNNLAFDLCVNNGFDLLGTLGVALQIDRVPLADANQRTDVQSDFLLKLLHSGYTTPVGSHIPSMFETTHTVAGQPFATKVQWPGDSLTQLYNLAGAVNYKVNTVGTPTSYTLSSATPADTPKDSTGKVIATTLTKWRQETPAKAFSYELQIPNTLVQGIGASGPAPGSFEYCTSKSPYCSNETGDTLSTQSMHFKASNETTANQYGVLGAGANLPAPTTCPAFVLLGDAHLRGKSLYLGYKPGSGGKVWIDNDGANTHGCIGTAGLNNGTLADGFSAQDRLVTFGTNSATTPVALTKSGTAVCPAGTSVGTLSFGLSRYFCPAVPVNTALPVISGQTFQASELTGSNGTWTPPAPNLPTFTYQWERCDAAGGSCVNIAGATLNKYTNTPADLGHTIRIAVTATNLDGVATAVSNQTGVITLPPAPVNTVLPTITGTIGTDLVATANKGTWINAPTAFAYQWQLCDDAAGTACNDIAGATNTTYSPSLSDQGHFIRVVVTASNIGGAASATSATKYVPPPPTNTAIPFIKNGAAVATGANVFEGDRLKAIDGTWTDVASFAHQWQKCDAAGDNCADIAGATSDTYAVVHDDIASTLRVKVTGTNPDGSLDAFALVTGLVQSNPYLPKAPNQVVDGQVLTGSDSGHETSLVGGVFDTVGNSVGGAGTLAATPAAASKAVTNAAHVKGGKVNAVASDTAGGYFLGGTFTSVLGAPCLAVAHVKADGTLDPVYCQDSAGLVGEVRALDYAKRSVSIASAATPIDVLVVGGAFTRTDGHSNLVLIDNTGLASFATTDPDGAVNTIADDTSANRPNFFFGGEFTNVGKRVAMVTISSAPTAGTAISTTESAYPGGVDCSGGSCTTPVVRTIAFGNPSSLPVVIVGGTFDRAFGTGTNTTAIARRNLAAFTENSGGNQAVGAWDPNPNGDIYSVIASSTTVLLSGDFTQLGPNATPTTGFKGLAEYGIKTALTSLSPLNWSAGPQTAGTAVNSSPNTAWKPQVDNGRVLSMIVDTAGLYVGGSFTSIGGTSRHRLAQVTLPSAVAPTLGAWDPNAGQTVRSIAKLTVASPGISSIFAGGDFSVLGGETRNNLAELAPNGTFTTWAPAGTNGAVKAIVVQGGVAYVGGAFTNVGAAVRNHLAAFASDGTLTSWDPNADGVVSVLTAKPGGGIYVGGTFANVGGALRANLAELDSAGAATPWNPGTDGAVRAIALRGSSVFVGGTFANAGGALRSNLAEIDSAGAATGWNPAPDGAVNALAVTADGVYAGGAFGSIAGVARNRLAFIGNDGEASAWDPGADGDVLAVKLIGSKLLVGGTFANLGGLARNFAGLVNDDGTAAEFAPDPNGAVAAILYTPGNLIGLFGSFTSLQGGATPTVGYGFFGGA